MGSYDSTHSEEIRHIDREWGNISNPLNCFYKVCCRHIKWEALCKFILHTMFFSILAISGKTGTSNRNGSQTKRFYLPYARVSLPTLQTQGIQGVSSRVLSSIEWNRIQTYINEEASWIPVSYMIKRWWQYYLDRNLTPLSLCFDLLFLFLCWVFIKKNELVQRSHVCLFLFFFLAVCLGQQRKLEKKRHWNYWKVQG